MSTHAGLSLLLRCHSFQAARVVEAMADAKGKGNSSAVPAAATAGPPGSTSAATADMGLAGAPPPELPYDGRRPAEAAAGGPAESVEGSAAWAAALAAAAARGVPLLGAASSSLRSPASQPPPSQQLQPQPQPQPAAAKKVEDGAPPVCLFIQSCVHARAWTLMYYARARSECAQTSACGHKQAFASACFFIIIIVTITIARLPVVGWVRSLDCALWSRLAFNARPFNPQAHDQAQGRDGCAVPTKFM